MIRPTLFIGLGTTGLKILKSLRQLMFEEYGHEGLPIFRYVSIETDGDVDGTDEGLIDGIQVVKATIPTTTPISYKLDSNQPESIYNEHLEKWLNSNLLNYVEAFTKGASNIRMAGRLCLWENWSAVRSTLTAARMAISAPNTIGQAVGSLTKHYAAKGQPIPDGGPIDSNGVNAYIVGSLCGGSCSGMMIDVAYFCRNLLGAGATKKVYGIFTMFDEGQAAGSDEAIAVRAANCFAALSELNYYNHLHTTYDVTFPSGETVYTVKTPFDYATFVSRSNMTGGIFAKDGEFDEDGLNLMAALNLFAETAGDTDGQKAAILTDGAGFTGIGELKDVPKGEIPTMVRSMASFGLTAVWYPKYRIARAATCLVSRSLCQNWLETHVDQAVIVANANKVWDTILNENIDILGTPKGQLPIKQQIMGHLGKASAAFKSATSADQLKNRMENFPLGEGGPFRNRFVQGGEYFEVMNMQVSVSKTAFCAAIEQTLNNQLAQINFKDTYSLGDVRALFETLDKEVEKAIDAIPANFPTLDLSQLNFDLMHDTENNRWIKFIFLHDQSVESQRKALIDAYRRLIIEDRTSIYQSVRNYLLRPVLRDVRAYLGFGVPPTDVDTLTVKKRLDQIEANLKSCVRKFDDEYEEATDQPNATAVKIVTNNPQNRIDTDAETISATIGKMNTSTDLLNGRSMATFLNQEHRAIMTQMTETYQRLSLDQIPVKNVVEQVRKILEAGGAESIDIKNLASRSDAYQSFIPGYKSFNFAPPLKIICGHDPTEEHAALTALQRQFLDLGGVSKFPRIGSTAVDHLLFFYQGESGFALDDLAAYEMLKKQFEKTPGPYGHHTHQDPDFYDLALYHKIHKLQQWCRALGRLVPEICRRINRDAFSRVFYLVKNRYVFEYNVDGLSARLGLHDDFDGIKRLSQKRNETAYDGFFKSVRSSFMRLDRGEIGELVNSLLREVEDGKVHARLMAFYGQFLDEVYNNSDFTSTTNAEAEWDTHFSSTTSQIQEEIRQDASEEIHSGLNQNAESERSANATADVDSYDETHSEDVEYNANPSVERTSESSVAPYEETIGADETGTVSEDPRSQDNTADANQENVVWVEAASEDEFAEEAPVEEIFINQEPQPEGTPATDAEKKQSNTSKEFSVADVDPEMLRNTRNTRKKR